MVELVRKAPWHLWVVGALAALWSLSGAADYTMTQTRNAAYLDQFTAEQLAYFASFPTWFEACWALGVWGAFTGSLLLLFRSRFAFHAYVVALIGTAGTTLWTLTNPLPDSLSTVGTWILTGAIIISLILLVYYARRMRASGVLR